MTPGIARSLHWRLLSAAVAAILLALCVAWLFMTFLFERHLERRLQEELVRDGLRLVAALSLDASGVPAIDPEPMDPRLQTPAGGYYWQLSSDHGAARSRSLWDADLPRPTDPPLRDWRLRNADGPYGERIALVERVVMPDAGGPDVLVQLAQDRAPLAAARSEFGRELALFLLALWLALSLAAWLQVRLGLRPLGRIRGDLAALRESASARLPEARLREIQPLTDAINSLADARERELESARNRAADLAHGLKTPLAALAAQSRRAREAGAEAAADGMDRAIDAIGRVVDGAVARTRIARIGQARGVSADIRGVAERLVNVLEHTERGERLAFAIDVPDGLRLDVAEEHLSEILGAVLENAAKYARRQVRIMAESVDGRIGIGVEDDGDGIAPERRGEALARGRRLDQADADGNGLGLAIARELVEASGGGIRLGRSVLGGLAVMLSWASRGA